MSITTNRIEGSTSARESRRSQIDKRISSSTEVSSGETAFKIVLVLSLPNTGIISRKTCIASEQRSARRNRILKKKLRLLQRVPNLCFMRYSYQNFELSLLKMGARYLQICLLAMDPLYTLIII